MDLNPNTFIYLEVIRRTLLALPGINEKLCFGTPAFYAGKKIIARVREDGETIMVNSIERDKWMNASPDIFFITDHYKNYDCLLINLERVSPNDLETLLITAWKNRATAKMIKQYKE